MHPQFCASLKSIFSPRADLVGERGAGDHSWVLEDLGQKTWEGGRGARGRKEERGKEGKREGGKREKEGRREKGEREREREQVSFYFLVPIALHDIHVIILQL